MELKKNKKGFTLVEIIVVLIIMGILVAIAVPSVMSYVGRAEDQRDLAQAHVGYQGAQTVLLQERVNNRTATDAQLAALITAATVEDETDVAYEAINCTVTNGQVAACSIQLETGSQWANFTVGGEATMTDTPTVAAPGAGS